MNTPLNCDAQDMLEAAILQHRRLDVIYQPENGEITTFQRVLPIEINSQGGTEQLAILTTDNLGGILKLKLDTAGIHAFEAKDFKDPKIQYNKKNEPSCGI